MKNKSNLVGIIIPDIPSVFLDDYYSKILAGIDDTLRIQNYSFQLFPEKINVHIDLNEIFLKFNLSGCILINWYMFKYKKEVFKSFKDKVVLINDFNSEYSDFYFITGDNKKGGEIAASYLAQKKHKKIAVILGFKQSKDSEIRFDSFRENLKKYNIEITNEMIEYGNFSKEGGYNAGLKLLKQKEKPTAIFCLNDEMAFGVMEAAKKMNIQIPDDLSLLGYDNHSYSELLSPPLSTIDQHIYISGKQSATILLNMIEGGKNASKICFIEPSLIPRNSVKELK